MTLRSARSMGDIASRRFGTHFDFPDKLLKPALPSSPPPPIPALPSLTNSQFTATDDEDNSDEDFHFDFPQPPSISPALRRMRSSPWYSEQLVASIKPERRHSVSPLIHRPDNVSHPHSRPQGHHSLSPEQHRGLQSIGEALRKDGVASEHRELSNGSAHKEPLLPRRMERLPPPAPAPSIPLPRLPRIIRKVASMRSDSKHSSMEPSRRQVPKIRSLKFLSGSGGFGNSVTQSQTSETRQRTWSFTKPARPSHVPSESGWSSYIHLNASTSDSLYYASSNGAQHHAPRAFHHNGGYASPAVYSNPCLLGDMFDRQANAAVVNPTRFDLSKGNTSLAPPFMHRTTKSNPISSSSGPPQYFALGDFPDTQNGYSTRHRTNRTGQCESYGRPISGLGPPAHSLYGINDVNNPKGDNTRTLLQVPKSFIDVTPERKSGRARLKYRSDGNDLGSRGGFGGLHMGTAVKEKGEKMRKLLARASTGVVDWGRQLTWRSSKSTTLASASGSLAPAAGIRS